MVQTVIAIKVIFAYDEKSRLNLNMPQDIKEIAIRTKKIDSKIHTLSSVGLNY